MFTTTYHPRANGQAERFNKTIVTALRHYVADHPKDWDLYSDLLTFGYNSQVHSSTRVSPFSLVLSRVPRPLSIESQPQLEPLTTRTNYHGKWLTRLRALLNTSKEALASTQARYKRNFDERLRKHRDLLRPGSFAFVRKDYSNPREDTRHKLAARVDGPFFVHSTDAHTAVLKMGDNLERISLDRVTPAPSPLQNEPRDAPTTNCLLYTSPSPRDA